MPVSFRILPEHNLVLVTYTGIAGIAESIEKMAQCSQHPDFRPWMRHCVDMSAVTGHEHDFVGFFALQAKGIEMFPQTADMLLLFIAPTRIGQELANMARRTWEGLDRVSVQIAQDEAAALSMLGIPLERLAELGQAAD